MAHIKYGYAFNSKNFTNDSVYPQIIRIRDIKKGFSETYYAGDFKKEYLVHHGDLLVGMDGEFNIERWKGKEALLNQRVCQIEAKDKINEDYLYFALGVALKKVERKTAFVTVKHLSAKVLNDIELNVPSFNEQIRISDILLNIKKSIKLRQLILKNLDELIKARFVEMFGTIENNIFNYQVVELGKYVSIQGGYAFKSKDFTNSGIRLVQISNVNKDFLEWNNINWLPTSFEQKYKEYLLNENDLVIAMTRPIIKSLNSVKIAKVSKSDLPSLLNQRVGRFIFNKNYVNPIFLEVLCKLQNFKYYIEKMSGNSLQPNVSGKQIEKYKIILPPLPLQNEFADFVQQVDKSKFENIVYLNKTLSSKILSQLGDAIRD